MCATGQIPNDDSFHLKTFEHGIGCFQPTNNNINDNNNNKIYIYYYVRTAENVCFHGQQVQVKSKAFK